MMQVSVRVPLRVDLAGGTLDLWPLYLFHPGARTVNVAVSVYAEVEVSTRSDTDIEVNLTDIDHRRTYASHAEMQKDPQVALIAKAVEHFRLSGLTIVTRTEAPRGSGLGGSSALAVATVRALADIAGVALEPEELIALVRDLETRLLGIPAGIQDYYPAVYGGLATLHLDPGRVARHPLPIPAADLAPHMVVYYSGIAHFSGSNNWEIYRRHIDGNKRVVRELRAISEAAEQMEHALEAGDFEAAGTALATEWQHRRELFKGIATPEIEKAILLGIGGGAWAGKVCGAGGGGCMVFLCPEDRRRKVIEALDRLPGRALHISPVGSGMAVDSPDIEQKSFSFGTRRRAAAPDTIEHLYLTSDSHEPRKPFALGEAIITFDEARLGVHRQVERAYLAPFDLPREAIDWSASRAVDSQKLPISADPPAGCELAVPLNDEALRAALASAEDQMREYLAETERLSVYENPSFGIHSEPDESPAAFLLRCTEVATEMIAERGVALESTFRRRIDQIRERSEKEQRESDDRDAEAGIASETSDVTRGSGQDLYNITTGRATSARSAETTVEADYLEKIALVQKAWDKELEEARIELSTQAESIEEATLVPAARNIEIARLVVVWQ